MGYADRSTFALGTTVRLGGADGRSRMLVRVPRSIRLWLAILASLILGVGLAMASTGQAASDHGDCKNDNDGNHNGYVCDGGGSTATDPPGAGKTVDADHGDCKNDNEGNHYGYVCGGGGGCTSN